jgi:hypothetical protein
MLFLFTKLLVTYANILKKVKLNNDATLLVESTV